MLKTKPLSIILGCEESQEVCKAFREKGHYAFSCDLLPCSGGRPDWHYQTDIFEALKIRKWDMAIFFPPCTYLTISANKWYIDLPPRKSGALVGEARRRARIHAAAFFLRLFEADIPLISIENPIGVMSSWLRKPDQVLQPWQFGHGETKATCLWLKGLPKLRHTNIVPGRVQKLHGLSPSADRALIRSKTFSGIAKAMADQWG